MRGKSGWRYGVLLVLLVGVMTFVPGTVSAYLADRDRAENQLTIGGNRIEIEEEFTPPEELVPGSSFTKAVRVKNVGHSSCYVRIKAVFSDSNVGQYCSLDWNTADFVYDAGDGFYYYTRAVDPEALTEYLFTTVTVSAGAPADLGSVSILVYAESCHSTGFADYGEAWENYRRNQP